NIQAGDVTRIVVAIDGEVAGPVRDAAETAGAIVIVGDLAIARQIDGGQPAGAVPDVAQLVTGSVDGIVDATLRIASHARIDAELRRPGGQSSRTERGAIPDLQSRPGRGCDRADTPRAVVFERSGGGRARCGTDQPVGVILKCSGNTQPGDAAKSSIGVALAARIRAHR